MPATASNSREYTYEEFCAIVEQEYEKYNMDVVIESDQQDRVFTEKELENELDLIREFANSITIVEEDLSIVDTEPQLSNQNPGIAPCSMPVDFLFTTKFTITAGLESLPVVGKATYDITCYGTVDVQNGVVIQVKGCNLRQLSTTNVTTANVKASYHVTNKEDIQMSVDGSVLFSWTEPNTNMKHTATVYGPFWARCIDPENYINY